MADIVQSLFGVTPELYQQAQAQRAGEQALQYAQLSPFQQANYAIGRGSYQLAGALGGTDPQLQMISTRNSIAKQINYNDPNSIMQGVQMLNQAGDTVGAMQLADVARKMESEMAQRNQRLAAAKASEAQAAKDQAEINNVIAQQIGYRAFKGGAAPEATLAPTAMGIVDQETGTVAMPVAPQSAAMGTALPPVGAAVPTPAAVAAPSIPIRQATGTKIDSQIQTLEKDLQELRNFPKVPGAVADAKTLEEKIKFLRESTKQRNFTGDAANAARYLYGTTDSEEIYRNYGAPGLAAIQEREKQMAQEKRPVTTVTSPVTISMQKGFGENLTETITGNQKAGRSAASTLGTVENMTTLLDEGVRTGFGQETLLKLGQVGQLFDPNFNTRGLAGQEAFQAFSTQIVLPQVKQLGANPTDTDLKFIVTGSPGLSKTVEGNKLLLDTLKLKLQREQDLARFSNQWLATNSQAVKTDPIAAQVKYNTDFDTYAQSSPLYGPAANTLRDRFAALGGQTRGSEPARRALQSGGLTR